jgi:hypothetical protein
MIEKTTPASAKSLIKPQVSDFPLQEPPRIERKEILEISGSQNRPSVSNAVNPSTFAPPKNESNFVISTSPAYIGVELEEVRKILEKFGNVKIIKIGDFFSLKVYPNAGLKTEGEAREFMQNIIKSSFFDVYVEKTPY